MHECLKIVKDRNQGISLQSQWHTGVKKNLLNLDKGYIRDKAGSTYEIRRQNHVL